MKLYLTALPALLGAAALLQLIPIRINLLFVRENKDDFFTVRISTLFSLLRLSFDVPVIRRKSAAEVYLEAEMKAGDRFLLKKSREVLSLFAVKLQAMRRFLLFLQKKKILSFLLKIFLNTVRIEKLAVHIRISTGDAALTGIACGLFWSTAGTVAAFLQRYLRLQKRPVLSIKPDFGSRKAFALRVDTLVKMRIFHITAGGLLLLFIKIRGGK